MRTDIPSKSLEIHAHHNKEHKVIYNSLLHTRLSPVQQQKSSIQHTNTLLKIKEPLTIQHFRQFGHFFSARHPKIHSQVSRSFSGTRQPLPGSCFQPSEPSRVCAAQSALQSMGFFPAFLSSSLVLEKCRQPKKPLLTERGEGCTVCRTWWRFWEAPEETTH